MFGPEEWHGHGSESVWAERISDNKFKLRNSPFFAKGVSFEDIVSTFKDNQNLVYKKTLISAGHSTYRLLVKADDLPKPFSVYWKPIENLGCSYEENSEMALRMYAVDVPPTTDVKKVYAFLEMGEEAGVWDFEEGHYGHIVTQH